ncbi:hypothetical protein E7T06_05260 [Deinococcus sp. Arct2-2]|uniref:hypothetical protein n=1 Tax=Deinococcus sp. Arct2-2 TaxID=2568653 RepID=UPI0010A2B03C|nr:hypothetical protein [Deinococcus sp. Arct2-2]THF70965.1 hypothetical protein E7T06_05260 [Deinococcus sp. Arct2-2]
MKLFEALLFWKKFAEERVTRTRVLHLCQTYGFLQHNRTRAGAQCRISQILGGPNDLDRRCSRVIRQ